MKSMPNPQLTRKDLEVIGFAGLGFTAKATAEKLRISLAAVKTRRRRALWKTDSRNMAEAVAKCYRQQLLAILLGFFLGFDFITPPDIQPSPSDDGRTLRLMRMRLRSGARRGQRRWLELGEI